MLTFTQSEITAYYTSRIAGLRVTTAKEWRCACPVHQGSRDSFAIDAETGQAFCHSECNRGWDIVGLEQELSGKGFAEAKAAVYGIISRPDDPRPQPRQKRVLGPVEAIYDYRDGEGNLAYQVQRHRDPKDFSQRRPDGKGKWIWNLTGVTRLPYRLGELLPAAFAWIVEGEKDVDNLRALGQVATCNSGGACHFAPELVPHFAGKKIAIIPDADEKGRQHAQQVAGLLWGTADTIKIVDIPDAPEKSDVSDFIAAGGTIDDLREFYKSAPFFTPEVEKSDEDRWVRTLDQEILIAGGIDAFWDLSKHKGVPTPFDRLTDALAGGMLPGEVYVLAASTGVGKTSIALQFIDAALRSGRGILDFSLEMDWRAVFRRLVASKAQVDLNEYRRLRVRGVYEEQQWRPMFERLQQYTAAYTELGKRVPLLVSNKPGVTPHYIIAESTRLKQKHSRLDFIVVDHMQLMKSDGDERKEYERMSAISRALKQVAVELKVPILTISQVSRVNSQDHRTELNISDCRGSGAIEEDAATVMLLYHDADDLKAAKMEGHPFARLTKGPIRAWLKVPKNRFGDSGVYLALDHYKATTRFALRENELTTERTDAA